jgi:16S rRNA A1518/A1519 N6-dimethyltransferase RsmA/KsgA/DIM1 with predicted DNA glycosylase/AP lyase activity
LAGGLALPSQQVAEILIGAGIDPQRRAETLSITEWKNLTEIYRYPATLP